MHDYDVIGYVDDGGDMYCADGCGPEALGYDERDMEVIFASHGAPAGTRCVSCEAVLTDDNEWVEPDPAGLEAMREAVENDGH